MLSRRQVRPHATIGLCSKPHMLEGKTVVCGWVIPDFRMIPLIGRMEFCFGY